MPVPCCNARAIPDWPARGRSLYSRVVSELSAIAQAAPPSGSAGSTSGSQTREENRAFMQRRVAAFGLMMTLLYGLFLVYRIVSVLVDEHEPPPTSLPWQALAFASFGVVWLVCRGRPRSLRVVQVTEELGVVVGAVATMVMGFYIPYPVRPDFIVLLSLTYILIARSILVPSTARVTLVLGGVIGIGVVISSYFLHLRGHDPTIYNASAHHFLRVPADDVAPHMTVVAGLIWGSSLAIAAATSKVIYGLREEVRDARRLGQYTLLEKLGEGGMGAVYRASHAMLRRPTAVKLLPPERLGSDSVARFEREVQLTARLTHPNTIRVFDYGRTPDGVFYYAMEYLDGASLADVVAEDGPMAPARVIHVLDQVASALTEAHSVGLIHRDIKPANIFLIEQGGIPDVAKVLDFGLVKQVSAPGGADPTLPALSRADSFAGTPLYMAPEAISTPDQVDARTDLYSLGAVGYFLLTGVEVFTGRSIMEVCSHHLRTPPVPPSQRLGRSVPADLEKLILACLEKDPAARPADARALRVALRACRDASGWSEEDARRWDEQHGEAMRTRQRRASVGGAATIEVDLDLRTPEGGRG
jgi:eukaryotic-like serine/threonine-protein kinase